jgi:hypothetical protein
MPEFSNIIIETECSRCTLEASPTHLQGAIEQEESRSADSLGLARTEIINDPSFDTLKAIFIARNRTRVLAVISLIADGTVSSEQLSLAELVEAYDVSPLDLTRFKEGRNKTYTQDLLQYVETFCAVLSACESPTADSNLRYQYLENTDSNHTLRDYCTLRSPTKPDIHMRRLWIIRSKRSLTSTYIPAAIDMKNEFYHPSCPSILFATTTK